MPASATVLVRYPFDHQPDDEDWLDAIAFQHRGNLADARMLSLPAQRTATFEGTSDATAFVNELMGKGRWRAWIVPLV